MNLLRRIVLICEDSDEDYETFIDAVGASGIETEVRRAMTGENFMAMLRHTLREVSDVVVVLLDLNVPGMDGREVLKAMRADAVTRELPIVVLTTSANPADVSYCYREGVNAYHIKPVQYPDHRQLIVDMLEYWFNKVHLPQPGTEDMS